MPRRCAAARPRAILGLRLAQRGTAACTPRIRSPRSAQLSLALEKAIERVGPDAFPAQDQATSRGDRRPDPHVLGEVLETAIADGKDELAAAAATALGR